jgi:hypothetical protein
MSIKQSQKNLYLPHKDCRRKKNRASSQKPKQRLFGLCLYNRNQIFSPLIYEVCSLIKITVEISLNSEVILKRGMIEIVQSRTEVSIKKSLNIQCE